MGKKGQDFSEEKKRRAELKERNRVVTRPIGRLPEEMGKKKSLRGGKKLMTPRKMRNAINRYFAYCEEMDEVPTIKGMMIHMGLYKDLFYKYIKYPEFTDIMEQARMHIANWAEVDVYNTRGQAAGKIAFMKNIHGWTDKLETKNETEVRQYTVDEARETIERLAPKLLDVLKNQGVVEQIGHEEVEEVERIERRV